MSIIKKNQKKDPTMINPQQTGRIIDMVIGHTEETMKMVIVTETTATTEIEEKLRIHQMSNLKIILWKK